MGSTYASDLDHLLQANNAGNDPAIKTAVVGLGRELKSRLDRGSSESHDFFARAVRVLARIKGSANADARFDCLYDCAQYFYVGGYGSAALEVSHHLRALARLSRNRALERKAFGFSGVVYNEAGDLCEAVASHGTAASIAREIGDVTAEYRAITNLGVALMDAGLYQEALPCFQTALAIPEPYRSTTDILPTALTNIAKVHLHLGEFSQGLPLIEQAIAVQGDPVDAMAALKRTFREFVYVQLALELGRLSLARERAQECFRYARFGNTPRSVAFADIANALCEIYGGTVEKGVQILEGTARRMDLKASFFVETMPALIKAYDAAGRVNEALACLQELLRHVQDTRKKGIQALTDAHLASSILEMSADDQNALQSLKLLEADLRVKVAQREALNWRIEMFERMASTADLKEEASGEHSYRVGRIAALLSRAIGWSAEASHALEMVARLHDIGKIAMPDRILLSAGELIQAERAFIATHTTVGAELFEWESRSATKDGRRNRPPPPRMVERRRLSIEAERQAHPDPRPHRGPRGRVRRPHPRASVLATMVDRPSARGDPLAKGHAVRSRAHRRLPGPGGEAAQRASGPR